MTTNAFGWQGAPSFNGEALQKCGRFAKPAIDLPVPERTRVALRQFFVGVLPPSEIALRAASASCYFADQGDAARKAAGA